VADLQNRINQNKQIMAQTANINAQAGLTNQQTASEILKQNQYPNLTQSQINQNNSSAKSLSTQAVLNNQKTLTEQNTTANTLLPSNVLDPNLPLRVIQTGYHAGEKVGKVVNERMKAIKSLPAVPPISRSDNGQTFGPGNNPWDQMPAFQ